MDTVRSIGLAALSALALAACSSSDPAESPPAEPSYPDGPYGNEVGAVITDYRFTGWTAPAEQSFDTEALADVSLRDFYDPEGKKGTKLLLLDACALWCPFCREDAFEKELVAKEAEYAPQGVAFLQALNEDGRGMPMDSEGLKAYAELFDIDFPLVIDPERQLEPITMAVVPTYIVVSTRDMKVLAVFADGDGDSTDVWAFVDQKLQQIE